MMKAYLWHQHVYLVITFCALSSLMSCSTSTIIDEYRVTDTHLEIGDNEQIVIMGRRHAGEYETEPDFIDCIGNKIATTEKLSVMPEQQFLDSLYPWFEPRVAPLKLKRMGRILENPIISERIKSLGIRYMVWVDGNTETTEKNGAINCAISPAGGGCFGFASWDKTSIYEAIVWDLNQLDEEGRVKVETKGSSYLLAVGAPIPFIAQVQSDACEGIGSRLKGFFLTGEALSSSPKPRDRTMRNGGMRDRTMRDRATRQHGKADP
jgi:hypothetical protein